MVRYIFKYKKYTYVITAVLYKAQPGTKGNGAVKGTECTA